MIDEKNINYQYSCIKIKTEDLRFSYHIFSIVWGPTFTLSGGYFLYKFFPSELTIVYFFKLKMLHIERKEGY